MKTLTRFLAVAFLLAVVAFFAVGCASDGGGKLRLLIKQDVKETIGPLAARVTAMESTPPITIDLDPFNQKLANLSARVGATEAELANLKQGVEIAVAGSAAAKGVANQAQETANAGLKKAEAANKKADRALKIAQGELSPEQSSQARRQFAPRASGGSLRDFVEETGMFELPLPSGSSKISKKEIETLGAFLDARGLKIISIVGVEDRHLKAASQKEAERINRELAEDRIQSAKTAFDDWISPKATDRVSPAPPAPSKFPGGLLFLLGKDKP